MSTKAKLSLSLLLSLAALATACGGDDGEDSPQTPESTAAAAPASTASRPQFSDAQALDYTVAKYLAQAGTLTGPDGEGLTTDNWLPPAIGDVAGFTPTFTVAADGSGTHTTVQAAIDAVPAASASSTRAYILVKPGTYREVVCAIDKAPFTLYGTSADASEVVIVNGNYNGKAKTANVDSGNPCFPNIDGATYGTGGSATVAIYSNEFQAKNVSFANDAMAGVTHGAGYPAGASRSGGAQAVALMTLGDKLVFENVRVLGNQDTLLVRSKLGTKDSPLVTSVSVNSVMRAYFKASYVEGDTDFIFGDGVMVFDQCRIHFLSTRLLTELPVTTMFAPSTMPNNRYGMLVNASQLTADAGAVANTIYFGRSWDEGVPKGTYVAGTSPNGQALVRNSTLGSHIRTLDPWGNSTSGRAFSAEGNRFAEYGNTQASP